MSRLRTRPSPPRCIHLRVRPVRGLVPMHENALAQRLTDYFEAHGWEWAGGQIAGTAVSDDEFSLDDLVDLLAWLLQDSQIAIIELSPPHAYGNAGVARLCVHRSHGQARALCELHRQHLLGAAVVVQALGGFTVQEPLA